MIIGAHSILYSRDPEADRRFLRDVLGFPHVDVGEGWLIFGLPPAEVAVHPTEGNETHELYLMTDDVETLVAFMTHRGIETTPIAAQGWGQLTHVILPGRGRLGVYQPRHARPPQPAPVRRQRAGNRRPVPPLGERRKLQAGRRGKRPAVTARRR
jgi:catechol 2,3-dioxygenase-like lactoylglutathione lyase family enzyme